MFLILAIDLFLIGYLFVLASNKGVEAALPFATFALVLLPSSAIIPLGALTLSPQRIIVVLLLGLYVAYGRKTHAINQPVMMALIALNIVWSIVSATGSIVPGMSFKKLFSLILEYYSLYYVYGRTISSLASMRKILMGMVAAVFVACVFGFIETYWEWTVMSLFPSVEHMFGVGNGLAVDADRGARVTSTFDHPILFGAAIATGIITALYLLPTLESREKGKKAFLWLSLMLMFLNIYKTVSRGPWLAVMGGFVLLLLFGRRRTRAPLVAIVTLTVLVLVVRPGIRDTILGLYYNSLDPNTVVYASYQYRYALKDAAVAALSHDFRRALCGFGMESFYTLHLTGDFGGEQHVFLSCDSVWVGTMVETGYVGLLLLVSMLLWPWLASIKAFFAMRGDYRDLCLYLIANFLMFYFMMTSVAMYSWGQNGFMLWILITMALVVRRVQKREARTPVAASNIPILDGYELQYKGAPLGAPLHEPY